MDNYKKLLIGGITTLFLIATNLTSAFASDDISEAGAKLSASVKASYEAYLSRTGQSAKDTATQETVIQEIKSIPQVKKTREATTDELNGVWTKNRSNGEWTYHLSDGTHYEGWLNDNGKWYYISGDRMLKNLYAEGYYLGSDGVLTTPPATLNYMLRTITPQDVQATKELREKLLKEGWVQQLSDDHWIGDEATLDLLPDKDGINYSTECIIRAGVANVLVWVNDSWGYGNDNHRIELPLEKYLEYKKEDMIGKCEVKITTMDGSNFGKEYWEFLRPKK